MALKRHITRIGLLFTSVSCMIGSGWLFGPFYAAQIAGPWSIVSWLLGGTMILFIATTFAELSAMLPVTGGIARYSLFSHGTLTSFIMSWLAWLSCAAVAPTEVQALLQYLSTYFPALINTTTNTLSVIGLAWAVVLLFLITLINLIGIKLLAKVNNFITIWKLAIPIVVITALTSMHFEPNNFTSSVFNTNTLHNIFWALPSGGIIFSFLGFREATSLAGESKKPHQALPFAVIGSVITCTAFYLLLQLGFIGNVPSSFLSDNWGHLHFDGDSAPLLTLAKYFGLHTLVLIILADVMTSPLGTALIYSTTTSRLTYGMSVNKFLPKQLQQLNSFGIPALAVLFNFAMGLILLLPLPTWQALIQFQSSAIILAYSVGPISLLALRQQQPKLQRPFKVKLEHSVCLLTFIICNFLTYWTGWNTIKLLMTTIILAACIFLYLSNNKNKWRLILNHSWLIFYCLWITCLSYLGDFPGGIEAIPFGEDALFIVLLSSITFKVAVKQRLSDKACAELLNNDDELKHYLMSSANKQNRSKINSFNLETNQKIMEL